MPQLKADNHALNILPAKAAECSVAPPVEAAVFGPDPLLELLAREAAAALGFRVEERCLEGSAPSVLFLGLDSVAGCPRLAQRANASWCIDQRTSSRREEAPLTVGYVSGSPAVLAAHALHRCTDMIVRLCVVDGVASFVYDPPSLDVTPREADVLLLILAGWGTSAIARHLHVSHATARTHCRSILRKCGAANRTSLRARLLDAGPAWSACRVCREA